MIEGRSREPQTNNERGLLRQRNVGGLAKNVALRHFEPLGDRFQAGGFSLTQCSLAIRAISIDPRDMMNFLAGGFHQIA